MTIVVQMPGSSGGGGGSGPVIQPPGTIVARPGGISGALQTFTETTRENAIRSQGEDNQIVKVRRRATHVVRTGDGMVVVLANEVPLWKDWFMDLCQGGALPTRFRIPPNCGVEEVWRFAAPPAYDWSIDGSAKACRITMKLEQLPNWQGI